MGYTTVRSHMRNGHTVRAHSRRTRDRHPLEVLQRDPGPLEHRHVVSDCEHPGWYPVRRLLLDTPYTDSPILAYVCTECAATRLPDAEGIEWVPLKSEGQP